MPKLKHEALVQLVRGAPDVVTELLRSSLGLTVPVRARPRVTATELKDPDALMRWAERVVTARRLAEVFADDDR